MGRSVRAGAAGLLVAASCFPTGAHAQGRSGDNVVTQAEDGFGFSTGRESIGIYSAGNARGFSPTDAGNVRIDGLYFDPAEGLPDALVSSTSIRVGLSAQGYPFAAPSGIVDQLLRKPIAKPGGSLIANFDELGGGGVELDGSVPLTPNLSLGYGLTGNRVQYGDGTHAWTTGQSLIADWRAGSVEVVPFVSVFNDYGDLASINYVPTGPFLPRFAAARRYEGPDWSRIRYTGTNTGLLSSLDLGQDWRLRLGLFRSGANRKRGFTNIFAEQADGTGERITIADPPTERRSLSGEFRLTHAISEGPRQHVIHLSIRGRDAHREFGGGDVIDTGPGRIGEKVITPKPDFQFGELSHDRVRQLTYGVAYSASWKGRGQVGIGLSRAIFRKTTAIPEVPTAELSSSPWLYNANAAVNLSSSLIAYAGYARGLEESGVAPGNAANRNQPLPVILTRQKDAGLRFSLGSGLKVVVGAFDLSRPYFGYEAGNVFTMVGTTRSRGVEFSVSGSLLPGLDLVAGGVVLRPQVVKDDSVVGVIGSKPVGLPDHDFSINADWRPARLNGVAFDAAIHVRGKIPATTDNLVFVPPRTQVDVGTHYRFRLASRSATLRLQVSNLFDTLGYGLNGAGNYWRMSGRYALGYLTIDM
ncbi:TonB-dependent siderophore receptor [Sphingomonas sp.]|uniref:TonB-dependent siderophore receptor n=1 Tax=Sphingomonas sp. TaxID=28214 RepID=UPI0038A2597E